MLEYFLDKDKENLIGVVDYWIVNEKGQLDDKGNRVWINDIFVNPSERNNGTVAKFAQKIMEKVPWANYAYFQRGKYRDRIRIYPKYKWVKIVNKYLKKEENNEFTEDNHTSRTNYTSTRPRRKC